MKTQMSNKKVSDSMEDLEGVNWPVVISILAVMTGLMIAFYFMY